MRKGMDYTYPAHFPAIMGSRSDSKKSCVSGCDRKNQSMKKSWRRYEMAEKMTNADRIKKATDKELADMLCKITRCCSDCIAQEMCYEGHTGYEDWLASEEWSDFS